MARRNKGSRGAGGGAASAEGAKQGIAARRAAVRLLGAVLDERRMLSEATPALGGLAPPDRARALALAGTALRQLARIDAVLARFLERRPPPRVMNILRILATEILAEGGARHAAVDAAVDVARALGAGRLAGLVNAVGRRLEGDLAAMEVPRLPKAIRGALVGAWGEEAVAAMEAVHLLRPPIDLTVKSDPEGWAARLGGRLMPGGSVRLAPGAQVSALEGFAEGAWWVQDMAAAAPVRLLGDLRGARALDLCAAPGGKTMQLAAAGAEVTALDVSASRMVRLEENLARTGLSADCVVADALAWAPEGRFDVIVLDAPCSATGTIRRHPDLPHVRPSLDLAPLMELQAALLARAAGWLAPGGRLVYATCSLIPAEGERQVARALETGVLKPGRVHWPEGFEPGWRTGESSLRLRPDFLADLGGMDGFFAAVLEPA